MNLNYEVRSLLTAIRSDVGKVREINEDYVYISDPLPNGIMLAIVADGMGGHLAGEIASKLAVETIFQEIESLLMNEKQRWFSANLSSHEDGKSIVVVIRDTTARYAAEATLRRDRRIFHDLAQSVIQIKELDEIAITILNGLAENYGLDYGLFVQYNPLTHTLDTIAGVPQVIASSTGSPNPSCHEGNTKSLHRL